MLWNFVSEFHSPAFKLRVNCVNAAWWSHGFTLEITEVFGEGGREGCVWSCDGGMWGRRPAAAGLRRGQDDGV